MRSVRMGVATIISALAFLLLLAHLWASHDSDSATSQAVEQILRDPKHARPVHGTRQKDFDAQVRNETLGFEKVFVLNLPSRGDRLDNFVLSASLTGFTADVMPGINGSEIPDKSLPSTDGLHPDIGWRNAQVGTWRAHLNVARRIVEERLSSALIIEDDSDWDIRLKEQMVDFSHGARHFSETGTGRKSKTPYGDAWDMLWPGHCAIQLQHDKSPLGVPVSPAKDRFLIENDPTVPNPKRRMNIDWIPDMSAFPDTTRLVFKADMGICLYAYALSYRGAQKILRTQGQLKTWVPIDIGIGEMCQSPVHAFDCVGIFPQLVDSHKMAGTLLRNSDIQQDLDGAQPSRAYTWNMKQSSRLNTDRILAGQDPEEQWPEDPQPDIQPGGVKYRVIDRDAGARINIWPPGHPNQPSEDAQNKQATQ